MNDKLRNMTSVYLTDDEGILCLYRVGSRAADHLYVGSAGGHFEEKNWITQKPVFFVKCKKKSDFVKQMWKTLYCAMLPCA